MRLPVQQSLNSDRYKITPLESGNFFSPTLGVEPESCYEGYYSWVSTALATCLAIAYYALVCFLAH